MVTKKDGHLLMSVFLILCYCTAVISQIPIVNKSQASASFVRNFTSSFINKLSGIKIFLIPMVINITPRVVKKVYNAMSKYKSYILFPFNPANQIS